jgi:hypothetical protein
MNAPLLLVELRQRLVMNAPLLLVELRAVSPTSMEEGEKAQSVTLAMESLGTLWLRQSV